MENRGPGFMEKLEEKYIRTYPLGDSGIIKIQWSELLDGPMPERKPSLLEEDKFMENLKSL